MRNISKKFLLVTLTVFFCVLGYSQVSLADDNHGFTMLRMGVGARALAMGGAHTAVASDATAGYWNPAALAHLEGLSVSTMIASNMSFDRKYNYASIAYPFEFGALGFSWLNSGVSDFKRGTQNSETGTFDMNEHVFLFSYGNQMDQFFVGFNFKVLYQKTDDDFSETGVGFDASAKWAVAEYAHLGLFAGDLGTKYGGDEVPAVFRVGMAVFPMENFTVPVEIEKIQNRSEIKFRMGGEYSYMFADEYYGAFRAGVNDGSFTVGAGLTIMNQYHIDYAYITEATDVFGENHRVSIGFNLK
ncbi:MAG: PorV/PorQ family protein [candidate division Zixibacteria bacterium]|nr:PorV/PorQ family protein [candidate division Zixibacteria bacterium]